MAGRGFPPAVSRPYKPAGRPEKPEHIAAAADASALWDAVTEDLGHLLGRIDGPRRSALCEVWESLQHVRRQPDRCLSRC